MGVVIWSIAQLGTPTLFPNQLANHSECVHRADTRDPVQPPCKGDKFWVVWTDTLRIGWKNLRAASPRHRRNGTRSQALTRGVVQSQNRKRNNGHIN